MPCTTAIISGKHTADGRPLLYKHRDTGFLQNKLMAFSDGKYDYIGIVNSSDKEGKEVWGGYNSAGFAIMNSASYNLNPDEEGKEEREGIVMKLALQQCATIADFERLLESLPKPMFVSANFGVIDAQGGAAYYETGDYKYHKFDANDVAVAPMGYIIRTNYSFTGVRERDKGLSRYQAASDMFYRSALAGSLSYHFLLNDVSRCLTHGITGVNLYDNMPDNASAAEFVPFRDFIPRYSTSSILAIHGVGEKEDIRKITMWTIVGSPLTTVAVPVWLNKEKIYPSVLFADRTGMSAPLCNGSLLLKKRLFPIERGEGNDYLNLSALINKDGTGILQHVRNIETQIFENANNLQKKWNENGFNTQDLKEFCSWTDQYITESYYQTFNITIK